ncbi:MAG: hypothetical protein HYU42_14445 [Candidatus Rokubacteria bacterium]|nr:hypothetical protein [Candidatus Rokubacteria bacterium]MBI3104627.1 hypothetical protein [Candidatus Rokubacteria bacterium]
MRFRTFAVWTGGLALLGWAGYTAVSASSAYLAAREMTDQVLQDVTPRVRGAAAAGDPRPFDDIVDDVRQTLLIRARRLAIPIGERDVAVLSSRRGLTVELRWHLPVLAYRGDVLLMIPMSLERSVSVP